MSERAAVQNPMLKYADKIGWKSVSRSEAMQMRRGDTGLYFIDVLKTQLMKLNRGGTGRISLRGNYATVASSQPDT